MVSQRLPSGTRQRITGPSVITNFPGLNHSTNGQGSPVNSHLKGATNGAVGSPRYQNLDSQNLSFYDIGGGGALNDGTIHRELLALQKTHLAGSPISLELSVLIPVDMVDINFSLLLILKILHEKNLRKRVKKKIGIGKKPTKVPLMGS
ncbi:hypothetical protein Tco_1224150 [Tanacetum coccineum]